MHSYPVKSLLIAVFLLGPTTISHAFEGHMYGLRGLFGGVARYSYGVDAALDESAKGYKLQTHVAPWYRSGEIAALAIANYRRDKKPIILGPGHSLGANEISDIAETLRKAKVPVKLALYYDPTPFVRCVPSNVQVAVSWRRTANFNLGGGRIMRCDSSLRNIRNYNVSTSHTALDDAPIVHQQTSKLVGAALGKRK